MPMVASPETLTGTAFTVTSDINGAGPTVDGRVSSRLAPVSLSMMRRPISPV
jgi:hypothetical protein